MVIFCGYWGKVQPGRTQNLKIPQVSSCGEVQNRNRLSLLINLELARVLGRRLRLRSNVVNDCQFGCPFPVLLLRLQLVVMPAIPLLHPRHLLSSNKPLPPRPSHQLTPTMQPPLPAPPSHTPATGRVAFQYDAGDTQGKPNQETALLKSLLSSVRASAGAAPLAVQP